MSAVKLLKKLFPSLLASLNIIRSYIYDVKRFLRYNTNNRYRKDQFKTEAILIRKYHGLEKAFSLPNRKAVFGLESALALIDEVLFFRSEYGDSVFLNESINLLSYYYNYLVRNFPESQKVIDTKVALERFLNGEASIASAPSSPTIISSTLSHSITPSEFKRFFNSRFSTRNFKDEIVAESIVKEVLQISLKTPSACNRQPWNVRFYKGKKQVKNVLRFQNGNRGFGECINNLFLVTADLRAFSGKERFQAYVDGGLFSMSLMLSFHAYGIASCPLNTSNHYNDDKLLRTGLKIRDYEVPIMMIAFGYPGENSHVSQSVRRETLDILEQEA